MIETSVECFLPILLLPITRERDQQRVLSLSGSSERSRNFIPIESGETDVEKDNFGNE